MKADPETRERLARAAESIPVDVEQRLRTVHRRSRSRRAARRVAGIVLASAVVAGGVLSALLLLPLQREDVQPRAGDGPTGRVGYTRVTVVGETIDLDAYSTTAGKWEEVALVTGPASAYAPALSPDGRRLAFIRGAPEPLEVWVANADGSDARPLEGAADLVPIGDTAPAWSPDGSSIAVVTGERNGTAVWVIDPEGGEGRRVLRGEAWQQVAWSPDGKRLAVTGFASSSNTAASYAMAVVGSDGTGLAQVADFEGTAAFPAWSPDGSRIAVMVLDPADQGDYGYDVHIVKTDGTGVTRLTDWEGFDGFPVWSPDGRWIVFSSDRAATPDQLRSNRAGDGWFGASLHLMRPDGSGPHLVLPAGEASLLPTSWAA